MGANSYIGNGPNFMVKAVAEQAGVKMRVPLERVAKDSSPRSMPVSCPVGGNGCTGASAHETATYQPSASLRSVTVLGMPSMGRCSRMGIRPIFDRLSMPPSSTARRHPADR